MALFEVTSATGAQVTGRLFGRWQLLLILLFSLPIICITLTGDGSRKVAQADVPPLASMADTTNGIHLGLICDYLIPFWERAQVEVGHADYLWCPTYDIPVAPSIYTSAYKGMDWDTFQFGDNSRGLTWWKANHPDWLVYQCNQTSLASYASPPQDPYDIDYYVPLDISNPAVRDWLWQNEIQPAIALGNNSIGFDNVVLYNYTGKCGVWRNGAWVQLYSGNTVDSAYQAEVINWLADMYTRLHAQGTDVAINTGFLNGPSAVAQLSPYADTILDESGFTNYGDQGNNYITDATWTSVVDEIQSVVSQGKGMVIINYEPEADAAITPAEVQWVLANYLLVKGSHTFTCIYGNGGVLGGFYDRPEYHAQIGSPTSAMYQVQGAWLRSYANGLVLVNPSSSQTFTVPLPADTYQDVYGNPIGTSVTLGIHSGLLLLNRGVPIPTLTATPLPTATTAPGVVSTAQPIAYYPFQETSGTILHDASGNGQDGAWIGSSNHATTGKYGLAGWFDGLTYVTVPQGPLEDIGTSLTLAAWVKFSGAQSQYIIQKGYSNAALLTYSPLNGRISFLVGDLGFLTTNHSYNDGQWHYVAAVYDHSRTNSRSIYVDGVLDASSADAIYNLNTDGPAIGIGGEWEGGVDYSGAIEDLRIYNYPQTQAQIVQDMLNEGQPTAMPTLTLTTTPTQTVTDTPSATPTATPTSTSTPRTSGTATPSPTTPPAGNTLYPRLDLAHPTLGTLPASYHFGLWDAASSIQGPNAKMLSTGPGTAQQASDTGYLYQAGDAGPSMALDGEFLSAPLAAQTIPAGAWSAGLGIQGSLLNNGAPDYTGYLILNVINGSTGQVRGTLIDAPIGAEKTTEGSEVTAHQASLQGAAVTVQAGDYLEAEIGVRTLSSSAVQNTTLFTSGTTAITTDGAGTTNAETFLQAPAALTFQ
jgi:hypothetical protein